MADAAAGGQQPPDWSSVTVQHLPDEHKFVIQVPGEPGVHAAFIEYRDLPRERTGGGKAIDLFTTFTSPHYRGQGLAGKVAEGTFREAGALGWRVKPTCSYLKDRFVPKHPELSHVVMDRPTPAGGGVAPPAEAPAKLLPHKHHQADKEFRMLNYFTDESHANGRAARRVQMVGPAGLSRFATFLAERGLELVKAPMKAATTRDSYNPNAIRYLSVPDIPTRKLPALVKAARRRLEQLADRDHMGPVIPTLNDAATRSLILGPILACLGHVKFTGGEFGFDPGEEDEVPADVAWMEQLPADIRGPEVNYHQLTVDEGEPIPSLAKEAAYLLHIASVRWSAGEWVTHAGVRAAILTERCLAEYGEQACLSAEVWASILAAIEDGEWSDDEGDDADEEQEEAGAGEGTAPAAAAAAGAGGEASFLLPPDEQALLQTLLGGQPVAGRGASAAAGPGSKRQRR